MVLRSPIKTNIETKKNILTQQLFGKFQEIYNKNRKNKVVDIFIEKSLQNFMENKCLNPKDIN